MSGERRFNDACRKVIDEVLSERAYQIQRWEASDVAKEPVDWIAVLVLLLGKAAQELDLYQGPNFNSKRFRKRLVQVAATCMNAAEKY